MSVLKQLFLCLVLVAAGAAGWYLYQNPQVVSAARERIAERVPESVRDRVAPAPVAAGPQERTGERRGGSGAARIPGLAGAGGAINVITAPVAVEDSGEVVRALGTAKAARSVMIVPQVTGVVEEVLFAPGQTVEEGEVLVRIEDDEQAIAVERARLAVADAEAALERSRRLAESKTIAAVALSEAETAADIARIELRTAEIALSRRSVAAPFAGVTGLTDISVGDLVTTSTEIVSLDDLATIRVGFELPERRAGQVQRGQPVTAEAKAVPGEEFRGEIAAIDSRIDEATRTLRMEASLPNGAQLLKPGMAVTVMLNFDAPGQLSVPSLSVQWDRRGAFVWKVDGDKAERADISIISRLSGIVVVTGALQAGERVVVEGVQRLREGSSVVEVGDAPAQESPAENGPGDEPGGSRAPTISGTEPSRSRS